MEEFLNWFTWHWFPFWIGVLTIYLLSFIKFLLLQIPGVRVVVLLIDAWRNRKSIKDTAVNGYKLAGEVKSKLTNNQAVESVGKNDELL